MAKYRCGIPLFGESPISSITTGQDDRVMPIVTAYIKSSRDELARTLVEKYGPPSDWTIAILRSMSDISDGQTNGRSRITWEINGLTVELTLDPLPYGESVANRLRLSVDFEKPEEGENAKLNTAVDEVTRRVRSGANHPGANSPSKIEPAEVTEDRV